MESQPEFEPKQATKLKLARALNIPPYLLDAEEMRPGDDPMHTIEAALRKTLPDPDDVRFIMRQIRHAQGAGEKPANGRRPRKKL